MVAIIAFRDVLMWAVGSFASATDRSYVNCDGCLFLFLRGVSCKL